MGSLHVARDVDMLRAGGFDDLSDVWRWAAERDIPVAEDADPLAFPHLFGTGYPRLVPTRVLALHRSALWVPPGLATRRPPAGAGARPPERRRPTLRIRGRSDPEAAEAVLAGADEVDECAVLTRRRDAAVDLVAYCTLLPGWRADPTVLRSYLAARLPAPRVPAEVTVVAAFPRTADGGIDRAALAGVLRASVDAHGPGAARGLGGPRVAGDAGGAARGDGAAGDPAVSA